jgi:hypothetical protein
MQFRLRFGVGIVFELSLFRRRPDEHHVDWVWFRLWLRLWLHRQRGAELDCLLSKPVNRRELAARAVLNLGPRWWDWHAEEGKILYPSQRTCRWGNG